MRSATVWWQGRHRRITRGATEIAFLRTDQVPGPALFWEAAGERPGAECRHDGHPEPPGQFGPAYWHEARLGAGSAVDQRRLGEGFRYNSPPRARPEDLTRFKRCAVNRLGFAVQLCSLRYPGQSLGPGEHPPVLMLAFVAAQLGVPHATFAEYARRDQTRRERAAGFRYAFGLTAAPPRAPRQWRFR